MKFKDVAHLYIGCKVQWLRSFYVENPYLIITNFILADAPYLLDHDCKPILYPLSAITEEQQKVLRLLEVTHSPGIRAYVYAPGYKYLLENHFDLFNLIESGEAIDVTTLEKNPYLE